MSAQPQNLASLRQQQGTAVAERKPTTIFDLLNNPRTKSGLAVVAGKMLNPDRILKLATNAISRTPLLAECNPKSVLGSIMASTSLGLEFNTPLGHAYLIPYKRRAQDANGRWIDVYDCQFQIGYKGWIVLAHRSPVVGRIEAEAIHEGDLFDHMKGSETFLKFKKSLTDRGDLIGAYCLTASTDYEAATVLPLSEVLKIRGRSETYRALEYGLQNARDEKDKTKAQKKFDEQPWVLWEDDMAAKSAIKKHAKMLPIEPGDLFGAALQLDGAGDERKGEFIDLAALSDPDVVRAVQDGEAAPTTTEEAETGDNRPVAEEVDESKPQGTPAAAADPKPRQGRGRASGAAGGAPGLVE